MKRELQAVAEGATRSGETVAVTMGNATDATAYHCEVTWTPQAGGATERETASCTGTSIDEMMKSMRASISARRRRIEDEEDAESATRDATP